MGENRDLLQFVLRRGSPNLQQDMTQARADSGTRATKQTSFGAHKLVVLGCDAFLAATEKLPPAQMLLPGPRPLLCAAVMAK